MITHLFFYFSNGLAKTLSISYTASRYVAHKLKAFTNCLNLLFFRDAII